MKKSTWIWLAVVVVVVLYFWSSYNSLVTTGEGINNQWAQVQTQYQRRFDLIPNLVSSVNKVIKQEQAIFTAIAEARTRYSGAATVTDKVNAANQLETSLGRLLAVIENYPELKSAENVQTLMVQLEGTENRISVERGRFNDKVQSYNLLTKRFPSSLIAKMFSFAQKPYFEAAQGADKVPVIQ